MKSKLYLGLFVVLTLLKFSCSKDRPLFINLDINKPITEDFISRSNDCLIKVINNQQELSLNLNNIIVDNEDNGKTVLLIVKPMNINDCKKEITKIAKALAHDISLETVLSKLNKGLKDNSYGNSYIRLAKKRSYEAGVYVGPSFDGAKPYSIKISFYFYSKRD